MYRGPAAPDAPWASMLVVERTFWNPRGKEEFSETSSHTLRARALGRACRAGEPTRSRWENKIFYLKRHGTLTNEDDLLRWSALVCTLRCIGQRYLLQVRSLTPLLSPARCTDSGTLPRSYSSTLCIFDLAAVAQSGPLMKELKGMIAEMNAIQALHTRSEQAMHIY